MRRWMFEWCSGIVEPWHTEKEAQLALNQAAKQRSWELWKYHGKRVKWQDIRDGKPYWLKKSPEIDNDWWPVQEGGSEVAF